MSCGYSKEILALYIENDLPTPEAVDRVESHVSGCADCQQYCQQLRMSQSFIKTRLRLVHQQPLNQEMLTRMRRSLMAQINTSQQSLGWALKLERFLMLGFRSQRYAIVGSVFLAVISVSLLGQIRYSAPKASGEAAVFLGQDRLLRPTGYREWMFLGSSLGLGHAQGNASKMYHNVYINPAAYREYEHSGKFPDGTVMVLEMFSVATPQEPALQDSYQRDLIAVAASVKDSSRFDGGWGFYEFTEGAGKLKADAEVLPETAGCLACHRDKAATDHVFTQFYPVLRGIGS